MLVGNTIFVSLSKAWAATGPTAMTAGAGQGVGPTPGSGRGTQVCARHAPRQAVAQRAARTAGATAGRTKLQCLSPLLWWTLRTTQQ